jgi:hypothetical protein
MSHPLKKRINQLRSRVRLLLVLYGLSWVLGSVVAATLVLGLMDYLVRFQDPGLRLICSLVVVSVFAWTSYRYLCVPLRTRLRDVDLARGLERRYPELKDSLASAVEFLDQPEDDPTAGSLALRRAVIVKTTADAERLDFDRALERRPVQRATLTAAAVVLVGLIVVAADPLSSRIAIARLVHPFGTVAWPQTTHLALHPRIDRVARGQAFELEVIDRDGAKLPEHARIFYRQTDANGKLVEESQPMHILGDSLVARRENVTRPFSYRVEGGDDRSMPWIPVDVVDPPAVESLAVELIPPSYTGWPAEKTTGHIRALVGTRVAITGRATKPLASAMLCLEDGREIPGRVSADGRTFTIPGQPGDELIVEKSGAYWFKLTDREKLTGGVDTRWEIRAVADTSPTVSIEQPAGTVFVTPDAMVPLRVVAKDDLAVAQVGVEYGRSDQEGTSSFPLYTGPPQAPSRAGGLSAATDLGESRVVTYEWQLAPLGLKPGIQVPFHATAADYKPQTGQSEPARLAVITREELTDRIASRQAFILAELNRALDMQRQGRQQVATLDIRAGQIGKLDQLDVDRLQGAELNQRQVYRTLTSRTDGVPMHILGLLAELANNKIDSPDIQRRMQGLLDEIDRLDRDHLPAISHELIASIKTAQNRLQDSTQDQASSSDPTLAASLAAAGKHQDEVIAALEQMLGQLARWDSYRRFHREIGQLIRSQEALNQRTMELGRRTLAKELRDLLPQERADLKVAAREQTELARLFDRLLQGMGETADQLRQTDPSAAATIADAFAQATKLALGATMRAAGDGVEQNRIGQAVAQQKQVVENLQEILDILANRRDSEWSRLTQKLREAQRRQAKTLDETRQLDRSRDGQETLSRAQAARLFDLAREQKALQTEAQDLAARHASAEVIQMVLGMAASEMGRAGALLERRQTGAVTQEAEQNALARLGQLLAAFEQDPPEKAQANTDSGGGQGGKPQASQRRAIRNMAQLKLLRVLQEDLNRRTRELDKLASEAKSPDPMLQRQGAALGEEQGRLASLLMRLVQTANDPEAADPPSDEEDLP